MSDTPRIDATQYQWTRTLDLARTLERELAVVTRERETAYARGLEEGRKDLAAITRDWDEGAARERIAELARERDEARETVDYRNALVRSLADSLKKIAFMARTSGGWKPDAELIAACEQAEQLLSLPGMSKVIDERDALRAELAVSEKSSAEYMTERNQARDLVHTMAGICASGCGDNKPRSSIEWAEHILAERDALRAEVERLRGALGGIRDRDFKLSDAKRRAQRALLATEALQEPTR